jgi:hypothetical protein
MFAYIGPGSGLEFVGYAMWLVGMMGAAFLSILMWPLYKFLNWLRGAKSVMPAEQSAPSQAATQMAPPENEPATPPSASVP